jgi:clan AA aspartic protease
VIEGVVNAAHEAVITLSLQGPVGEPREVEAVVDTGFTGFLTLPPSLVTELGLVFRGASEGTLADGSEVSFDVYDATVLWDGEPRVVLIDEADTTPLVGMLLLDRHNLNIDVEDGGRVLIRANV